MKRLGLSERERHLLRQGLQTWGGPARLTDEVARAIGFESEADAYQQSRRLATALDRDQPLSEEDWRRVIAATEIAWASEVLGAASDWDPCTGFTDEETLRLLRRIQHAWLDSL